MVSCPTLMAARMAFADVVSVISKDAPGAGRLIKFKMGTCTVHSDLTIKLAFKKRLMLKISAISNDLNNILDELDTILDDPYDRYLSGAQTLTATTSTIVYFYVNSQ